MGRWVDSIQPQRYLLYNRLELYTHSWVVSLKQTFYGIHLCRLLAISNNECPLFAVVVTKACGWPLSTFVLIHTACGPNCHPCRTSISQEKISADPFPQIINCRFAVSKFTIIPSLCFHEYCTVHDHDLGRWSLRGKLKGNVINVRGSSHFLMLGRTWSFKSLTFLRLKMRVVFWRWYSKKLILGAYLLFWLSMKNGKTSITIDLVGLELHVSLYTMLEI